jgi:serine-type D-Ala-D-Ala carboxypeptidase/endopeptidase (penicillin-binding protein 4)
VINSRLVAVILVVLAAAAAVAAFWPLSPTATRGQAPLAAPLLDAARLPAFLSDTVAATKLGLRLDAVAARDQSCLVVDDSRGPNLYSRRPALPLLPASNLKLLTATALLARTSGTDRFRTEVRSLTPPVNGVINGNVWLVGGGDPLLATADFAAQGGYEHQPRPRTPLDDLADRLAAAGVHQIQGQVLGDESRYDGQRVVPTWSPSYTSDFEVGPISALTVNDNFIQWTPQVVPAPAPAANAASVLVRLLQANGVGVGGAGAGTAPAGAKPVAAVDSPPVGEVVAEMLTQSNNLAAELVTKELGHRFANAGTTGAGLPVIRAALAGLGMPLDGLTMVDGSGLDRADRATCGLLLAAVERGGPSGEVARGLPIAGSTGTLFRRFGGTPLASRLRAKTGTLTGVASFSGWLATVQGRQLAFSFVVNGAGEAEGRALEDRLAAALVAFPDAPPPSAFTGAIQ